MGGKNFADLEVWVLAMELAEASYRATASFPKAETYGLASQIRRSSVSIPANIAEGQGRQSVGDFVRHLKIAQGSLAELETHFELCRRFGFVHDETWSNLHNLAVRVGQMLHRLAAVVAANRVR